MSTMVFVNFPVSNLEVSTAFYEKLGFTKNPVFSNEMASCMAWDENFIIMLLSYEHYEKFIGEKTISDTKQTSSTLVAFKLNSIDEVKKFGEIAQANGGRSIHLDNGIPETMMYGLEVDDPDGNCLEPVWMAI